jgi:16S rRNA (uracil1498-N3)-methyltransferase
MCYILFMLTRHRDEKNLTRLFIPQDFVPEGTCDLSENQIHYLRNVLRLSPDAPLRVFNGKDGEWRATLSEIGKKRGSILLDAPLREQISAPDIWAVFAPIKKTRLDFITEKATELGATKLIPVMTDHCVNARINTARMEAQVIEAAEQCERLDVPDVSGLIPLAKLLETWPKTRILIVCAESGEALPLATAVKQAGDAPLAVLTGPEGGFSDAELTLLAAQDFTIMADLGPRILRAETALLAALAGLQLTQG